MIPGGGGSESPGGGPLLDEEAVGIAVADEPYPLELATRVCDESKLGADGAGRINLMVVDPAFFGFAVLTVTAVGREGTIPRPGNSEG